MDFSFMLSILPQLMVGLLNTIKISVLALVIGTALGIFLGIIRVLSPRPLQTLFNFYVTVVRGTPFIVQVYAAFFLLPRIGVKMDPYITGLIALVFNTVGYQLEIVRASLESIDKGQYEAAAAIGMTKWMALWQIILPQAVRRMIPPLTNELAGLVKASSVLSVIAVYELTRVAEAIIGRTLQYIQVYLVVALIYFAIIQLIFWCFEYLEQKVFVLRVKTPPAATANLQ